jgi:hypothetical protein
VRVPGPLGFSYGYANRRAKLPAGASMCFPAKDVAERRDAAIEADAERDGAAPRGAAPPSGTGGYWITESSSCGSAGRPRRPAIWHTSVMGRDYGAQGCKVAS